MKVLLPFFMGAAIVLGACGAGREADRAEGPPTDSPYVKIWVSKEGSIELDGKPAELPAVESTLAELAKKKGVVLYGRDDTTADPHPTGMKVIEMVVANRLPIRMSGRRDFSDAVGADGKLK